MLRQIDPDEDDPAALTCLRCGLTPSAQLPEIRHALARAWAVAASIRSKLEESDRHSRRRDRRETYGVGGKRIGRPRKESA